MFYYNTKYKLYAFKYHRNNATVILANQIVRRTSNPFNRELSERSFTFVTSV